MKSEQVSWGPRVFDAWEPVSVLAGLRGVAEHIVIRFILGGEQPDLRVQELDEEFWALFDQHRFDEIGALVRARRSTRIRTTRGAHQQPEYPKVVEAEVYPKLRASSSQPVALGVAVSFVLRLDKVLGAEGGGTVLRLRFPPGHDSLQVQATATSQDFTPQGRWYSTFTLDREMLDSKEGEWVFGGVVCVDRPSYTMTVSLLARGHALGTVTLVLARGVRPIEAAAAPAAAIAVPSRAGADYTISLKPEGETIYSFHLMKGAERVGGGRWENLKSEEWFSELDKFNNAANRHTVEQLGLALWSSCPSELKAFLDDHEATGASTLFCSEKRTVPIELMRIRPRDGLIVLGEDRPITRWIDVPTEPRTTYWAATDGSATVDVHERKLACIRPTYASDELPHAAKEETFLRGKMGDRLVLVADREAFDALLKCPDVGLVHFAGHGDLGELIWGSDNDRKDEGNINDDSCIRPTDFEPSSPLMKGRPVVFLNACSVGKDSQFRLSGISDFVGSLLEFGARAVVASTLQVHSETALAVAKEFYAALGENRTIPEAVWSVRKSKAESKERLTRLSYMCFSPANLRVDLG